MNTFGSPEEAKWYQKFDINRHTDNHDEEKSRILIVTRDDADAKKRVNTFNYKQAKWEYFKIDTSKSLHENSILMLSKIDEFRQGVL